ncbi:MAG: M15 family metallopeptidase [Ignavibacteriales bacterium]|nr:M15 family metallopeptidase [Ignavibacteriales bacterium]
MTGWIIKLSLSLLLISCSPATERPVHTSKTASKDSIIGSDVVEKDSLKEATDFLFGELKSLVDLKIIDKKKSDKLAVILTAVKVEFINTEGSRKEAFLIVHKEVASQVRSIFKEIADSGFVIDKIEPMSKYKWSDDSSMVYNNTSCFNYRLVSGTRSMSKHAYGLALDINPFWNPFVSGKRVSPKGAKYDITKNGTIHRKALIYKLFIKNGWKWGGDWIPYQDYQHFFNDKIKVKTF